MLNEYGEGNAYSCWSMTCHFLFGFMNLMHVLIFISRKAPNKSSESRAEGEIHESRKRQEERFSSEVFGYLLCFKGTSNNFFTRKHSASLGAYRL